MSGRGLQSGPSGEKEAPKNAITLKWSTPKPASGLGTFCTNLPPLTLTPISTPASTTPEMMLCASAYRVTPAEVLPPLLTPSLPLTLHRPHVLRCHRLPAVLLCAWSTSCSLGELWCWSSPESPELSVSPLTCSSATGEPFSCMHCCRGNRLWRSLPP